MTVPAGTSGPPVGPRAGRRRRSAAGAVTAGVSALLAEAPDFRDAALLELLVALPVEAAAFEVIPSAAAAALGAISLELGARAARPLAAFRRCPWTASLRGELAGHGPTAEPVLSVWPPAWLKTAPARAALCDAAETAAALQPWAARLPADAVGDSWAVGSLGAALAAAALRDLGDLCSDLPASAGAALSLKVETLPRITRALGRVGFVLQAGGKTGPWPRAGNAATSPERGHDPIVPLGASSSSRGPEPDAPDLAQRFARACEPLLAAVLGRVAARSAELREEVARAFGAAGPAVAEPLGDWSPEAAEEDGGKRFLGRCRQAPATTLNRLWRALRAEEARHAAVRQRLVACGADPGPGLAAVGAEVLGAGGALATAAADAPEVLAAKAKIAMLTAIQATYKAVPAKSSRADQLAQGRAQGALLRLAELPPIVCALLELPVPSPPPAPPVPLVCGHGPVVAATAPRVEATSPLVEATSPLGEAASGGEPGGFEL